VTVRLSITNPDQRSNRSQKSAVISTARFGSDVCGEYVFDFRDWSGHERSPVAFGATMHYSYEFKLQVAKPFRLKS